MSTTSRSVYRDTVTVTRYPDGVLLPAAGAQVRFYEANGATLTPLTVPLYASPDSTTPLTMPLTVSAVGEVEVWSDEAGGLRARQVVVYRDRPVSDEVVDFEPPPGTYATRVYVDEVMDAHEADLDPHDQYLTQPDGNLLYLPLSHQPGVDPHPQYLKTSVFGQPDPRTQYQLESALGQPNGYVPLDANRLIPTVHLPPLAITNTFVVASQAEMLALVAQTGDVAIRTDTSKSYILAADPASVLGNWKELSAAAPVLSVNGYTGVVNLTAADVGALTAATADPLYVNVTGDSMSGGLYSTQWLQAPTVFLTGPPGATSTINWQNTNVNRWALQTAGAESGGSSGANLTLYRFDDAGTYLGTALTFNRATGEGTFTNRIVANAGIIAAGDAEFYGNLYARTNLYVTTALTVAGKPVAVSPDAGNILSWLPNGFYASLTTANVTVLRRQEFSPPASSNSVTLTSAPSSVLEVSRNGVAQSAALGHYTVAGAVITFSDPFGAGEQVQVLSEVGVSQPVDAYSKAQADTKFVDIAGDTMTGGLTTTRLDLTAPGTVYGPVWNPDGNQKWYAAAFAAGDWWLVNAALGAALQFSGADSAATFLGNTTVTKPDPIFRLTSGTPSNRLLSYDTNYVARWRVGVTATAEGGSNAGSDFAVTRYDDAGTLLGTFLSGNRATGAAVFGGPVSIGAADTTLTRTAAGRLQLDSTTATAPVALTFKYGSGTSLARIGQIATDSIWITTNVGYNGTNWNRDDTTKGAMHLSMSPTEATFYTTPPGANPVSVWTPGAQFRADGAIDAKMGLIVSGAAPSNGYAIDANGDVMVRGGKSLYIANAAFTGSAGWRFRDPDGLAHVHNGSPSGSYFASTGDLYVKGALNIQPGTENLAGEWLYNNGGARSGFVGLEGDYTTWRVYGNMGTAGNRLSINLSSGGVSIPGTLGVSGQITSTGGILGNGGAFVLSATNNIQLGPAAGFVHPDGDNVRSLGHPTLRWNYIYGVSLACNNLTSPGQLDLVSTNAPIVMNSPQHWVYIRSSGHVWFDGSTTGQVSPELDNKLVCGGIDGHRWKYVSAAQGSINTCWAHEKEIVGTVDNAAALEAVLATPLVLFHPKDGEGTVDTTMLFAGPVNTSVDPRLQIGEGALTAAGHQVAYAMAAIKALAAEVADLKARLA